jgi:two-component system phosphate regulon sensor histidine kinase PhoR
LKTPITSIKGFAETLLEGEHDPATLRGFLERIARQANRLHALIEDILSLSRVEHAQDRGEVKLELGDLASVLHNAAKACEAAAVARSCTLDVQVDEGLKARLNAPLLEQAVINLIDNAIKYGGAGKEVRIEVGLLDTAPPGSGPVSGRPAVEIAVVDRGDGIAPEHIPRLTERFYRVEKGRSRRIGGTGLGLAIVKHVVRRHQGHLRITSEIGRGSRFAVLLPLSGPDRHASVTTRS